MNERGLALNSPAYSREFKDYCGRERVILRRRRLKLRLEQFHIIAQVGQGGYGEVFLARKHTRYSLEEIGGYFGGRDHTTVLHAVRTVDGDIKEDNEIARQVQQIDGELVKG